MLTHANESPIASAGSNQTVNENTTTVILDGSKSIDRDGVSRSRIAGSRLIMVHLRL